MTETPLSSDNSHPAAAEANYCRERIQEVTERLAIVSHKLHVAVTRFPGAGGEDVAGHASELHDLLPALHAVVAELSERTGELCALARFQLGAEQGVNDG